MAYLSSSEDEFPEIEVIARRQKQKTTVRQIDGDKENVSKQSDSTELIEAIFGDTIGKTPTTARRVRKLGQGQPMDGSLLKPWQGSEVEKGTGSRTPSSRQPSWAQDKRREASATSPGELLDRLPARSKRAESRTVSGSTIFDSPPKEQKRTRRLISRGEKKALSSKLTPKEEDWIVSSDESGSDDGSDNISLPVENDESDFSLGGDSDSDETTPPQRSQSPSGPRRMQRRVLSSSRDLIKKDIKKEPTRTKPTGEPRKGNTTTSPKKQPEKRNAPKVSTTRQLKAAPKGNLEDVFEKLKIFNEDSELQEPAARDASTPTSEPMTPRKNLTASPAKAPRIPMSPWKPEHKEFWDPEVNFAWIDQHSPPKKSTKKKNTVPDLTAPENKEELKRRYGTSPEKKQARKAFDAVKEDLARDFLVELDEVVTDGELARLTETTGGLRIVWSNTLLTTAGRAHWKCKTTTTTSRQQQQQPSATSSTMKTTTTQHYASIELATKVLSNESDLLNTVAHEFCHLAVFLLDGKPKQAHGPEFKTYGRRVMMSSASSGSSSSSSNNNRTGGDAVVKKLKTPRDRGVEINVTTRHSYEIEYRFVWRCADCGGEVRRHSRSVDPTRQRCGRCQQGILVQVKPVPRGSSGGGSAAKGGEGAGGLENSRDLGTIPKVVQPKPEKKKTAYQEFTSREMKALSVSHKSLSFGEKMAMVSARWSEHRKLAKSKTDGAAGSIGGGGVKGLAAAVEVLEIKDDFGSDGDSTKEKKAVYDIFA
ncbi:SprT-like family-domain-containing protein [Xylaria flabelliformis]|nr:SprT-like family-domain-containing protein [Xylaria flabelliformis]